MSGSSTRANCAVNRSPAFSPGNDEHCTRTLAGLPSISVSRSVPRSLLSLYEASASVSTTAVQVTVCPASALAGHTQTRENTKNHARPHTAPSRGIP